MKILKIDGGNCTRCTRPYAAPDVHEATGGLVGSHPVVCGDRYPYTDECYKIGEKKADLVAQMTTKRGYAASVTINSTLLWITGGWIEGRWGCPVNRLQSFGIQSFGIQSFGIIPFRHTAIRHNPFQAYCHLAYSHLA